MREDGDWKSESSVLKGWRLSLEMAGDMGSILSSGKNSAVGERALSAGSELFRSSHPIQSLNVPKLKIWSDFEAESVLGRLYAG